MTDEWIKDAEKEAQQQSWDFSNMEILLKLQSFIVSQYDDYSIEGKRSYDAKDLLNKLTKHFFNDDSAKPDAPELDGYGFNTNKPNNTKVKFRKILGDINDR